MGSCYETQTVMKAFGVLLLCQILWKCNSIEIRFLAKGGVMSHCLKGEGLQKGAGSHFYAL